MLSRGNVRAVLHQVPILEGEIGGAAPMFVERYLFRSSEASVPGLDVAVLITQFGGGRVREGGAEQSHLDYVPSQSGIYPRGCPTHWRYSGTVDFAVFYLGSGAQGGILERLLGVIEARAEPVQFTDLLVGAAAMQLVEELQQGRGADQAFMERLAGLMLEQVYRVLTNPAVAGLSPRHPHFLRLAGVLGHIREHLDGELSVATLAARAGLSVAHFRRLFQDAMGVPPHRYVLAARIEHARILLGTTSMPISRIAEACGFSSQSHLTASFRAVHAATPAEYRLMLGQGTAPGPATATGD